jgi:thiol-disulfide isomerase/thioredoxin
VRRLLALVVVLVVAAGCASGGSDKPGRAADRLPDVTLASLTGGDGVDLGTLRGPAVVNLWAQWCGPCKRELPIYQEFFARHAAAVSVLGIDWQDTQPDRARRLASRSGVAYPLVVDREPAIRAQALPRLVLVDADGRIAFQEYVEIKSLGQLERLVEEHLGVSL